MPNKPKLLPAGDYVLATNRGFYVTGLFCLHWSFGHKNKKPFLKIGIYDHQLKCFTFEERIELATKKKGRKA